MNNIKKLFSGKRKLITLPISAIFGLALLPFVIGGGLAWLVHKKVYNKKLQYTALGIIGFFTLFIGSAWAVGMASPSNPPSSQSPEPSEAIITIPSTPTPIEQPTPTQSQLAGQEAKVVKVIDGDTFVASVNGKNETIRIIGINTPETVDPRKKVECFGQKASEAAKKILTNQTVQLESDPSQSNRDKYDRLLRYVWTGGIVDFGKTMIAFGYAYEYTYDIPYKYQSLYKQVQKEAQDKKLGLWADDACPVTPTIPLKVKQPVQQQTTQQSTTSNSGACKYSCSGADKDCSDFSSHSEAQEFFQCCGFTADNDPMRLDSVGMGDGVACESI